MKEFLHNGERVVYQQTLGVSFLSLLNDKGIIPEELPIEDMSYRVFKYEIDGVKRYACVMKLISQDEYSENVYITWTVPEDGFYNMMMDVLLQEEGKEPQPIRSRLSVAIELAEKEAHEWIAQKYSNEERMGWIVTGIVGYPEEVQKDFDFTFKLYMNKYGYNSSILSGINVPRFNLERIKRILE